MTTKQIEDAVFREREILTPEDHVEVAVKYAREYVSQRFNTTLSPGSVEFISRYHGHVISWDMLGWRHARDMLCDFAGILTAEGKPWPPWLKEYAVSAMRNGEKPRRKRGRDPYGHVYRDQIIAFAVDLVVESGVFRATRNAATEKTECGCSIVAEALKGLGISLSEASVAAIWRNHKDILFALSAAWLKTNWHPDRVAFTREMEAKLESVRIMIAKDADP